MPTYSCVGNVRGECGHKHTSRLAALRCLNSDRRGCSKQGGYSDRSVVRDDGEPMVEVDDLMTGKPMLVPLSRVEDLA